MLDWFSVSLLTQKRNVSPRHFSAMSLITCPAMISPITDGTNAVLPGTARRTSPSGWNKGVSAGSVEYATFRHFTLRAFNSLRIARAKGHALVL